MSGAALPPMAATRDTRPGALAARRVAVPAVRRERVGSRGRARVDRERAREDAERAAPVRRSPVRARRLPAAGRLLQRQPVVRPLRREAVLPGEALRAALLRVVHRVPATTGR